MAEKVESLLASLRGEAPPEPELEAPPALEAPLLEAAPPVDVGPAVAEAIAPLQQKIQELEAKLEELAAPPPLEAPPEEAEPPPEPPQPPTELSVFLQTRMQLLEKKLELAQQEALRSNLLLREREGAQRKAQKEVEDLFKNIREQQRASSYDRTLRDSYSKSREQIRQLEERLALAELRMVPAEDVLGFLENEEGRAELARRIKEQLAGLEAAGAEAARKPAPPGPRKSTAPPDSGAGACAAAPGVLEPQMAVLLGRIADLERHLEESEAQRDKERGRQRQWEEQILENLQATRRQYQKAGGPELLVEATLETMVDSLRKRDALQREMGATVTALQCEPPDSGATPALRAKLADLQAEMRVLQERIDKQTAIVTAWVERGKGT